MNTLTYSAARARLSATMAHVVNDRAPVIITRGKHTPVVMLSLDDYTSMQETAYLLRNPHNAQRLLASIAQLEAGQRVTKTLDELDALAQAAQ